MTLEIGFLCSGELGFHCLKLLDQQIKPQFVFTDKHSYNIIEYAANNKYPLYIGNPRKEESKLFIKQFTTDIIFSINYFYIVNQNILNHPNKFAINFHGSLLPKYRGRTPHVWAIINGESETGITAHIMNDDCDTGDIILQESITIKYNCTGADILEYFKEKYPEMLLKILNLIGSNKINPIKQEDSKATFFGKRTPEDGQIDWNWQKERIRNWVRAQADPYPGAFTFLNDKKIIIDEISYSDYGFSEEESNGMVVKVVNKKPYIKTPNGVVILEKLREEEIIFQNNMLLG